MSDSWMVCPFLEESQWASGSWVTLLQVLLFVDAHKPIVDLVQYVMSTYFPFIF